jgi:hypothetical protein
MYPVISCHDCKDSEVINIIRPSIIAQAKNDIRETRAKRYDTTTPTKPSFADVRPTSGTPSHSSVRLPRIQPPP